jgi:hypothetical protein
VPDLSDRPVLDDEVVPDSAYDLADLLVVARSDFVALHKSAVPDFTVR